MGPRWCRSHLACVHRSLAQSTVCPSLVVNGTIQAYAKIDHHCVPTIGRRDDAAGQCPGATDSGSAGSSTQSTPFCILQGRRSSQDCVIHDGQEEDDHRGEARHRPRANHPETESQLRPGNEDRQRPEAAGRGNVSRCGDHCARLERRAGRRQAVLTDDQEKSALMQLQTEVRANQEAKAKEAERSGPQSRRGLPRREQEQRRSRDSTQRLAVQDSDARARDQSPRPTTP